MIIRNISITLLFFFTCCNGPLFNFGSDPSNPQKTDFVVLSGAYSTSSNNYINLPEFGLNFIEFDKSKYNNIDSIILQVSVRSQSSTYRCLVQLYNVETLEIIPETELTSKVRYTMHSVRSRNISYYIPDHLVTLGLRIKSEIDGNHVEIGSPNNLIIYYRE